MARSCLTRGLVCATSAAIQALALARAAERCVALRLLTICFFLLKAYFCAETDEARPRRSGRGPPPRLTPQGVRQGAPPRAVERRAREHAEADEHSVPVARCRPEAGVR